MVVVMHSLLRHAKFDPKLIWTEITSNMPDSLVFGLFFRGSTVGIRCFFFTLVTRGVDGWVGLSGPAPSGGEGSGRVGS